jgi:hypothetical protein
MGGLLTVLDMIGLLKSRPSPGYLLLLLGGSERSGEYALGGIGVLAPDEEAKSTQKFGSSSPETSCGF